jgi:hypothetical protein
VQERLEALRGLPTQPLSSPEIDRVEMGLEAP